MRILVVNDDGIDAKGLRTLVQVLSSEHEVYVCAPMYERSAAGHSVTYFKGDIITKRREVEGAVSAWAVDGTPADCTYYGLFAFYEGKIDLVVSGINHGANLSTDVLYSGTVGAAMEGVVQEVPAIAVSLCSHEVYPFDTAAQYALKMIPLYMKDPDAGKYVLSINVPAMEEIKGMRVTHMEGLRDYRKNVRLRMIDEKNGVLICRNQPVKTLIEDYDKRGDVTAVSEGYVSLTPLYMDLTDHEREASLSKIWES